MTRMPTQRAVLSCLKCRRVVMVVARLGPENFRRLSMHFERYHRRDLSRSAVEPIHRYLRITIKDVPEKPSDVTPRRRGGRRTPPPTVGRGERPRAGESSSPSESVAKLRED